MLALYGLPAMRFLKTSDREERLMLAAVAKRALQLKEDEHKNLASHIARALGGKR